MLDLLRGIRVVSFNHFLLGPVGVQFLGDLGADVIAVENIEGAWQRHWSSADAWRDGNSMLFLCGNRNKRSLAVDLKSARGRDVALRLVDHADVVAENFRPGVMDKLGLGCETLRSRKPSLIYAAASGYGPKGPYAERPGQDLLAQALFGLMAITGQTKSGPRPVGVSAADHHGAALLALGILAALVRRMQTGEGCRVDVNLMQAALDLQAESLTAWLNAPQRPTTVSAPEHVAGWYYPAPYGVYATRDGHLAISLVSLETLAEALHQPRLAEFSEQDGWTRRSEIASLVAQALKERTTAEWVARMESLKIWHAPVHEYDELLEDPQVKYNRCFLTVPGAGKEQALITLVNHPVQYDGQSAEIGIPPQPLGAQTAEILAELGYTAQQIDSLQEEGIVRQAGASAAHAERTAAME